MIPRGEVGLVFVGIGAELGILSNALTVAIVLMVITTTLIAPLLLRWTLESTASAALSSAQSPSV